MPPVSRGHLLLTFTKHRRASAPCTQNERAFPISHFDQQFVVARYEYLRHCHRDRLVRVLQRIARMLRVAVMALPLRKEEPEVTNMKNQPMLYRSLLFLVVVMAVTAQFAFANVAVASSGGCCAYTSSCAWVAETCNSGGECNFGTECCIGNCY